MTDMLKKSEKINTSTEYVKSDNLTEQWKKGKFVICNAGKCQYYYVQNEKQQEVIKTEYCLFDDNTPNWQILAPVPTFDEWKASYNCMLENEVLRLKNAQLKELLKWCRDELFEVYSNEIPHHEDAPIIKKLDEALK